MYLRFSTIKQMYPSHALVEYNYTSRILLKLVAALMARVKQQPRPEKKVMVLRKT